MNIPATKPLKSATAIPATFTLLALQLALGGPMGTAFTWQVRLTDSGNPATGLYDFELVLFDAAAHGTLAAPFKTVTDGYQAAQTNNDICIFGGNYPEALTNLTEPVLLQATNGTVNIGMP